MRVVPSIRALLSRLKERFNLSGDRIPQNGCHLKVHSQPSGNDHIGSQAAPAVETDSVSRQCHCEVGADSSDLSKAVHEPYGNAVRVCRIHRVPFIEGGGGFVGQGGSSCAYERLRAAQAQSNQPIDAEALRNVNAFGVLHLGMLLFAASPVAFFAIRLVEVMG